MHFLCLCAIYNHSQHWTENLVQCFLDQTHRDATLLLIDDRPYDLSLQMHGFPAYLRDAGVEYLYLPERQPTLMQKYDAGVRHYDNMFRGLVTSSSHWDAICVLDDDDVYLPNFLKHHAEVLKSGARWSYPEKVFSTFGQALRTEDAGGRFWASAAYSRSLFTEVGGFGDSARADFDQNMLSSARALAEPGRQTIPQYVYNWEVTQDSHVSGLMTGQADTSWYKGCSVAGAKPGFTPGYNESTLWTLVEIREKYPEAMG